MSRWIDAFDERQQKQIEFARLYAVDFHHGADGHNNMMIIAGMADKLDKTDALVAAARKVLAWYTTEEAIAVANYHTPTMTELQGAVDALEK